MDAQTCRTDIRKCAANIPVCSQKWRILRVVQITRRNSLVHSSAVPRIEPRPTSNSILVRSMNWHNTSPEGIELWRAELTAVNHGLGHKPCIKIAREIPLKCSNKIIDFSPFSSFFLYSSATIFHYFGLFWKRLLFIYLFIDLLIYIYIFIHIFWKRGFVSGKELNIIRKYSKFSASSWQFEA